MLDYGADIKISTEQKNEDKMWVLIRLAKGLFVFRSIVGLRVMVFKILSCQLKKAHF